MALWAHLTKFERAKVDPAMALRNSLGVTSVLAAWLAVGEPAYAFLGSLGAMNASFSDGSDPYPARARRMLASSLLSAVAIAAGASAGWHPLAAAALILAWALGAGLLVAIDAVAADIGLLSLVMVLVFTGQPMLAERILPAALAALAGGCLQTLLAVAGWPIRQYNPERRVIAALYAELAEMARTPGRRSEAPPVTARANEAQAVVRALATRHSVQAHRLIALVSQAERIRLSILAQRSAPYLREVALITEAIARSLQGESGSLQPEWLEPVTNPALAGQLRAAADLAQSATPAGEATFAVRQRRQPWRLRVEGILGTLRAAATLRSAAMRHAIRLAVAVLAGEAAAHSLGGSRSYWLPMTTAIVLKPDFTATFSRGVLRIAGTLAGLAGTTALFHFATPSLPAAVGIVFVIVFVLRCYGPAHYGILTAALSAYIVLLFALGGQPPGEVIAQRTANTLLGGTLALVVYTVWPTWERTQIHDTLAALLEAYRHYCRAIHEWAMDLDQARLDARLARANAEAALDRLAAEPRTDPATLTAVSQLMASSHRLVHALMAVESSLTDPDPAFVTFAHRVELTLYTLAAVLRGSAVDRALLPDLRAAQEELVRTRPELTAESDRLTNSLNTLAELTFQLC